MTEDFKVNQLLGKGLDYILERDDHQKLITKFATLIKNYILENQDLVQSRVKKLEQHLKHMFENEYYFSYNIT